MCPSRRSHHRQWNLTNGLCLALDAFPRAGCATNRRPSQRAERHSRGARRRARKAALLFLCVNTWEVRSLLSLKRATQCLNVTCPYAARHWGFNRYWRAFGVDFGKLVGRGRGYVSLRIHRYVSRKKLKARGCRNAFVSDANCKGMRVGGHYVAAGERQQTPCQCWRRSNTADVTAASFGAGCCTQSYPSTLALLSAIGKSCDSAGLNTGPADLPVLEPTKFDLVIATRTAKALGLTIPQSLRVQAELIE